jgi:hypothetical protein
MLQILSPAVAKLDLRSQLRTLGHLTLKGLGPALSIA